VERYFAALESRNGSEACSLLTGEAAQQTERGAALVSTQLGRKKPVKCSDFVNLYSKALVSEPMALRKVKQVQVGAASLAGDTATVRVTEPHEPAKEVRLTKTSAGWRISQLRVRFLKPRKPLGE